MAKETNEHDFRLLFSQPRACVGCRACEVFCAYHHYGENNPSRALLRVVKMDDISVDIPVVCQHCGDAPCMKACPTGAIFRNSTTGAVVISQADCTQCRACMMACPYGVIVIDPKTGEVTKCDLCQGEPVCAKVCPKHAIMYARRDVGPRVLARSANQSLAESLLEAWRSRIQK